LTPTFFVFCVSIQKTTKSGDGNRLIHFDLLCGCSCGLLFHSGIEMIPDRRMHFFFLPPKKSPPTSQAIDPRSLQTHIVTHASRMDGNRQTHSASDLENLAPVSAPPFYLFTRPPVYPINFFWKIIKLSIGFTVTSGYLILSKSGQGLLKI
jgi:hypothetical protein